MAHIDQNIVASAVSTTETFEREHGFNGVVAPHMILQAYASTSMRRPVSETPAVETWVSVYLTETIQDLAGDMGHLCDLVGAPYVTELAGAFDVELASLTFMDGELDEPVVVAGPIDAPEMTLSNLHRARAALVGIKQITGGHTPVAADIRAALRQIRFFCDHVHVDGDAAILTGVGAWSSERRHPHETVENDVVSIGVPSPSPAM